MTFRIVERTKGDGRVVFVVQQRHQRHAPPPSTGLETVWIDAESAMGERKEHRSLATARRVMRRLEQERLARIVASERVVE